MLTRRLINLRATGTRRAAVWSAIALLSLALGGGCEDQPTTTPEETARARRAQRGFIALIGAGEHDPLWPILKTGAEKYAEQLGTLEVRCLVARGSSAQDQLNLLQGLQDPKMRGLCLQVIDPQALTGVLESFLTRGIPTVSIIQPLAARFSSGHAGFDDREVGAALADTTAKALDGRGSIMLLHAGDQHPMYGPRLAGFEAQIESHRGIEVFARIDCHADALEARKIIRERSARYPRLSAWVALDDWPVRELGQLEAVLPKGCRFITFGGRPNQWPLLRSGICPVVVAANYRELASKAIQFCETAIRSPSHLEARYHAPLRTVWSISLDDWIRDWTYWSTGQYPEALPK